MPGRVVKVLVAIDAVVKAGDPLLIIEAMKMESQVPAPIDGTVTAILVAEGDNVKTDETIIQLEQFDRPACPRTRMQTAVRCAVYFWFVVSHHDRLLVSVFDSNAVRRH